MKKFEVRWQILNDYYYEESFKSIKEAKKCCKKLFENNRFFEIEPEIFQIEILPLNLNPFK